MLHKETPFLRLLVPLCAGILSAYFTEGGVVAALLLAGGGLATALIALLIPSTTRPGRLFGISLTLFIFMSGFLLLRNELAWPAILDEQNKAVYTCRVSSYPIRKPASHAIMTRLLSVKGANDTVFSGTRGNLLVYYLSPDSAAPDLRPGDIIVIDLKPEPFTNRGNPAEFDYAAFMLNKGARYYAFVRSESLAVSHRPAKISLKEKALITGRRITAIYSNPGLSMETTGLLTALTLGNKEMIDEDIKEDFSNAGIMHVMAVSGLHAGVISMFVFAALFFLRGRLKFLRVILSIAVLWAFAFITGLPPSVERASLMFTFLHGGKLLKRPPNTLNSILASAFVMLVFKPSDITSLSFQLSYSAVIFISLFFRRGARLLKTGIRPVDKVLQLSLVSVLAQAGTLPFTLNAFGSLPLWFLPANIIIIPLASMLIVVAFILVLVSGLGSVAVMVANVADMVARFTIGCAGWLGGLPGSGAGTSLLPWPETILMLLLAWSFMRFLVPEKERRIAMPLIVLILLVAVSAVRHSVEADRSELIIYNSPTGTEVGLRSGRNLLLICDSLTAASPGVRHARAAGLEVIDGGRPAPPVLIKHRKLKILICSISDYKTVETLRPDLLIAGTLPRTFSPAFEYEPPVIVVTSGKPGVLITAEEGTCYPEAEIHYIMIDGAYVLKIPSPDTKKSHFFE